MSWSLPFRATSLSPAVIELTRFSPCVGMTTLILPVSISIVPADWVAGCRRADKEAFKPLYGERFAAFPEAGYSRQWWVFDAKAGRHAALGVFGQMIYIDAPSQIVAVKLSSWPDFLNDRMRGTTILAIEAISRELSR